MWKRLPPSFVALVSCVGATTLYHANTDKALSISELSELNQPTGIAPRKQSAHLLERTNTAETRSHQSNSSTGIPEPIKPELTMPEAMEPPLDLELTPPRGIDQWQTVRTRKKQFGSNETSTPTAVVDTPQQDPSTTEITTVQVVNISNTQEPLLDSIGIDLLVTSENANGASNGVVMQRSTRDQSPPK